MKIHVYIIADLHKNINQFLVKSKIIIYPCESDVLLGDCLEFTTSMKYVFFQLLQLSALFFHSTQGSWTLLS